MLRDVDYLYHAFEALQTSSARPNDISKNMDTFQGCFAITLLFSVTELKAQPISRKYVRKQTVHRKGLVCNEYTRKTNLGLQPAVGTKQQISSWSVIKTWSHDCNFFFLHEPTCVKSQKWFRLRVRSEQKPTLSLLSV